MAESNLKRNKDGYGYKYTDLAQIHEYLESNKMRYIQKVERLDGDDYIFTKRYIDGKWEEEWLQGCRIVQAVLVGKNNPAQEQGSALTYARRYSLLMAFGLACEDDDAQSLTKQTTELPKQKGWVNFEEPISTDKVQAFKNWFESKNLGEFYINSVIEEFGYKSIEEIKNKDLKKITDKLQKEMGE